MPHKMSLDSVLYLYLCYIAHCEYNFGQGIENTASVTLKQAHYTLQTNLKAMLGDETMELLKSWPLVKSTATQKLAKLIIC